MQQRMIKTTIQSKSIFLFLFFLAILGCGQKEKKTQRETVEKLPNIIYVLADDLGYGDINAFNPNGKIKTPHIDKLASEGMKFTSL